MAQNSYSIYLDNDGSGNSAVIAKRAPATVPAGGFNLDLTPQEYFPATTGLNITAATNATPIAITTASSHGYATGDVVFIRDADGNTAANGTHKITVTGATTFTLDNSVGNAAYSNAGTTADPYATVNKVPRWKNLYELLNAAVTAIEFDKSGGA